LLPLWHQGHGACEKAVRLMQLSSDLFGLSLRSQQAGFDNEPAWLRGCHALSNLSNGSAVRHLCTSYMLQVCTHTVRPIIGGLLCQQGTLQVVNPTRGGAKTALANGTSARATPTVNLQCSAIVAGCLLFQRSTFRGPAGQRWSCLGIAVAHGANAGFPMSACVALDG
jgi:hypothetical protein